MQLAGAQTVPVGHSAQLRSPEHCPVSPQVEAAYAGHSSAGSVPAGMALQIPTCPASAQLSHVPAQRASQHTPSVQKPLAQAASLPQG